MNILQEYTRIMKCEYELRPKPLNPSQKADSAYFGDPVSMRWQVEQLSEIAKSSLTMRYATVHYGLDLFPNSFIIDANGQQRYISHETVAAHSNLASSLADRALLFIYGPDFGRPSSDSVLTVDGYSHLDIAEALRAHDLPENDIGDLPDNGSTNLSDKAKLETEYYNKKYRNKYPIGYGEFGERVFELLGNMESKKSPTGRLIYLADKTSAIFMTLTYDLLGIPPMKSINDPELSSRDITEMRLCDFADDNGFRKASEMWTVDHFSVRRLTQYDDVGFFTGVIVMYTLLVNGKWYTWREKDYHA